MSEEVLCVGDLDKNDVEKLLDRFGLSVEWLAADAPITATFWGEPEAGIVGQRVFLRADTPVHSMLHEACHIICMDSRRREDLHRDAGGDDLEESAVCYLQIILADHLPDVGRERLMRDMDVWGYSFRLGSARRWFDQDSQDASAWLSAQKIIDRTGNPRFTVR